MGQRQSSSHEQTYADETIHEDPYHCCTCKRHFVTWNEWIKHRETSRTHRERQSFAYGNLPDTMRCDVCSLDVQDSQIIMRNVSRNDEGSHATRNIDGPVADVETPNHVRSDVHQYTNDQGPADNLTYQMNETPVAHYCQVCHEEFATAALLQTHEDNSSCGRQQIEEDITLFHCGDCDTHFNFEDDFLRHLEICDVDVIQVDEIPESLPPPPVVTPKAFFECPVCLEEKPPDSHLSSASCGHLFCTSCIEAAIRSHRRCPICRKFAHEADLRRIFI
ncbi:hypothetical protein SCHPADRAFT_623836 [Schizopora paradoxa]|uniref:RING-type domain-containing protein n=1 Tax=Schizopora paradoxa TaxID=27342 RepID=A0A0H2RT72_9AGAM|nr:hypothetical protein SCHPADRAFT_623836 [Schizopora paradoxa]